MTQPRRTFRRDDRLRRNDEFQSVYEQRCSVSDANLLVFAAANGLDRLRLGLSVGRKVGNAVCRNRLRRMYREAFRLTRGELPTGFDLILIPRAAEPPTLTGLQNSLRVLVPAAVRKWSRRS